MSQAYSNPKRASDPYSLPDVEVFYHDGSRSRTRVLAHNADEQHDPGWYYWYCFPGCLPDSEPMGPFATEAEALADAQADVDDDDDSLVESDPRD